MLIVAVIFLQWSLLGWNTGNGGFTGGDASGRSDAAVSEPWLRDTRRGIRQAAVMQGLYNKHLLKLVGMVEASLGGGFPTTQNRPTMPHKGRQQGRQ